LESFTIISKDSTVCEVLGDGEGDGLGDGFGFVLSVVLSDTDDVVMPGADVDTTGVDVVTEAG
jgi:hypothetical protein